MKYKIEIELYKHLWETHPAELVEKILKSDMAEKIGEAIADTIEITEVPRERYDDLSRKRFVCEFTLIDKYDADEIQAVFKMMDEVGQGFWAHEIGKILNRDIAGSKPAP